MPYTCRQGRAVIGLGMVGHTGFRGNGRVLAR
jgi:hypothetical protein